MAKNQKKNACRNNNKAQSRQSKCHMSGANCENEAK